MIKQNFQVEVEITDEGAYFRGFIVFANVKC